MGYVDIRERRDESTRARQGAASLHEAVERRPYPLLAAVVVLGGVLLFAPLLETSSRPMDPPPISLMTFASVVAIVLSVYLTLHGLRRLIARKPENRGPEIGAEKQLLLALRDQGNLTAVEAALETSLSVDEAEDILTHLANRGHLLVEGRDGSLCYSLPGRIS